MTDDAAWQCAVGCLASLRRLVVFRKADCVIFSSFPLFSLLLLFSSLSMEECEALCSNIGILVNGQLKCLGSSQHLKSRFGRGFQLDISTAENDATAARAFILQHFSDAEKLEDYGGKMKYKILHHSYRRVSPSSSQSAPDQWRLKDIFALIEQHKASVGISEYSVGQTTLEQIFIRFAKRGDIEEFGGRVQSEEAAEAETAAQAEWEQTGSGSAAAAVTPANRTLRRVGSFGTEDSQRVVTPSSFGYVPAESGGINF